MRVCYGATQPLFRYKSTRHLDETPDLTGLPQLRQLQHPRPGILLELPSSLS
jgi:hypothetical protein